MNLNQLSSHLEEMPNSKLASLKIKSDGIKRRLPFDHILGKEKSTPDWSEKICY